jgi:hypothetical protein
MHQNDLKSTKKITTSICTNFIFYEKKISLKFDIKNERGIFYFKCLVSKEFFFNLKLSLEITWLLGLFHLTTPFKAQMLVFTIR